MFEKTNLKTVYPCAVLNVFLVRFKLINWNCIDYLTKKKKVFSCVQLKMTGGGSFKKRKKFFVYVNNKIINCFVKTAGVTIKPFQTAIVLLLFLLFS